MSHPVDLVRLLVIIGAVIALGLVAFVVTVVVIWRRTSLKLPARFQLPAGRRHEQVIDLLRAGSKEGRPVRVGSLKKPLGLSYKDLNYVIDHLEGAGAIKVRRENGPLAEFFAPYAVTLNYKAREGLGDGGPVSVRDIIVQAGPGAEVAVLTGNVSIDARVFMNAVRERIDDPATPEEERSKLRDLLEVAQRLGENVLANVIAAWLAKQVPGGNY